MRRYVLGFLFSKDRTKLAVVIKNNKNGIPSHKGLMNAIGGKCLQHEIDNELSSMRREFSEETGIWVQNWKCFMVMSGEDWISHNFVAFDDNVVNCKQMEDEIIKIINVKDIKTHSYIHNLPALIEHALDDTIIKPLELKY